MRTCAVLPVKRFDDAKQRLDKTLNAGTRRALAEAMVSDVLHALRRSERIDKVHRGHRRERRRGAGPRLRRRVDPRRRPRPFARGARRRRLGHRARLRARTARARRLPGARPARGRRAGGRRDERTAMSSSSPTATARGPTPCCSRRPTRSPPASVLAAASATSRRPAPAARAGAWPSRARWCSTSTPPTTSRSCAPRWTRAPAARRTRAACWRGSTGTLDTRAVRARCRPLARAGRSRPARGAPGRRPRARCCATAATSPATCSWSPTRSSPRPRARCARSSDVVVSERARELAASTPRTRATSR